MAEWRTIGRGAAILGATALAGLAAYELVDTAGSLWQGIQGTVPYLNNFTYNSGQIIRTLALPAGIGAGLFAGYKIYRKLGD